MDLSFRDWAGLPAHIVDILVTKINQFYDYIRFRVVCTKWRCVAIEANVDHTINFDVLKASRKKLPMLLFSTDENNDESRGLYCVSSRKTYTIKLPFPYKFRLLGSSRGWLFCVDENLGVNLVNPFKNGCIALPVFEDRRFRNSINYNFRKGILLSDSSVSPDSFGVVLLYTCSPKLAFFKSGWPCWNLIKSRLQISDIIYYNDKLYGISFWGQFVQIHLDNKTIKTLTRGTVQYHISSTYLVESQDGELLMVKRAFFRGKEFYVGGGPNVEDHSENKENDDNNVNGEDYDIDDYGSDNEVFESLDYDDDGPLRTYEFKVFKMTRLTEESPTWVEMNNIGEQALFVSDNHSASVSTTDFPGCMPNSIYYISEDHNYIDPYYDLNDDSGVFNLENGRIYNHHVLGSSYKYTHPPIWFVPNP